MSPDEDLATLLAYLGADPDPSVRARAADSLADVEPGPDAFRVVGALLGALEDPEPSVVAAVIEALEDVHDVVPDPSIREAVRALAEDEDDDVRAAVESFEDWVSSP